MFCPFHFLASSPYSYPYSFSAPFMCILQQHVQSAFPDIHPIHRIIRGHMKTRRQAISSISFPLKTSLPFYPSPFSLFFFSSNCFRVKIRAIHPFSDLGPSCPSSISHSTTLWTLFIITLHITLCKLISVYFLQSLLSPFPLRNEIITSVLNFSQKPDYIVSSPHFTTNWTPVFIISPVTSSLPAAWPFFSFIILISRLVVLVFIP